jgi:hypothetical protein
MCVHQWDRLERSFILVSATARFAAPRAITASTSSVLDTATCTITKHPVQQSGHPLSLDAAVGLFLAFQHDL